MDIAGKVEPRTLAVFDAVDQASTALEIPYFVMGAMARDLILHHGHGAPLTRATNDVDFAIEVRGWSEFERLKEELTSRGFITGAGPHRLLAPEEVIVDIVPFGSIASGDGRVWWPPDHSIAMEVTGFADAARSAIRIRLRSDPSPLDVPVAALPGLVILKIIAWVDRSADQRPRDAADLRYLLGHYETLPDVMNRLYEAANTAMMEKYDWDPRLAGAHLLGVDVAELAERESYRRIQAILEEDNPGHDAARLAEEMARSTGGGELPPEALLGAFTAGLSEGWPEAAPLGW